jgi:hypothetical protein
MFKSGAKWKMGSEVKCRSLVECAYYHGFTVMYFVCGLLYSMSYCFNVSLLFASCLLLFVMFKLIVLCFFLNIHFRFVFLFCMFSFLLCVLCVFMLFCALFHSMYIVVYSLFAYNFTNHCHRMKTQLQLIYISYHIYIIHQQPRHSM